MGATFIQLQDRVKRQAKLTSSGESIPDLVKDTINMVYYDLVREIPLPELLVRKFIVSLVDIVANDIAPLPADFLVEQKVIYNDSSTTNQHRLASEMEIAPPAPIFGLPKTYKIVFVTTAFYGITLVPKTLVDGTNDKVWLDYFKAPPRLTADADVIPSNKLDEEIVKRALNFLYIHQNELEMAREVLARSMRQTQQPVNAR